MRYKVKLAMFLALFLMSLITWMIFNNQERINQEYTDFGVNIPPSYPVLGVDVSHHQGDINWGQLSVMEKNGDSIQFAFIKATEGVSIKDVKLSRNVKGARTNDLDCGLYHYFIPSSSAIDQADFFVDETFNYNYSLLPVLDVEVDAGFSAKRLVDSVIVFMDRVEARTKERPIIYTYFNFYETHFKDNRIENEFIWIAKYSDDCPLMTEENVLVWQFSEAGTVNGINGKVDLNLAKKGFLKKVRIKKR